MQTSALYSRLRAPMTAKEPARVSALALLSQLPRTFTTEMANKVGEELGIKVRAVGYQLRTLYDKGYIERVRQGLYRKAKMQGVQKNVA